MCALLFNSLLSRFVIARVNRVGRYLSDIRLSGNLSWPLQDRGSDELSVLARDINGMVDALEKSQKSLESRRKCEA